jgi:cyclic pyranopterin phosphate synthase
MPDDMVFRPNAELMQDEEVLLMVRLFANLGFTKFRLTGGEPTVRANFLELVRAIKQTPGVDHLTMTTNGVLLRRLAQPLAEAGLQRVNISLDTIDPDKFIDLTRRGKLKDVWEGIQAAEEAGLIPIKINAVIIKDYNEDDMVPLARMTYEHPWQIRYIEMMPFGGATDFQLSQLVPASEMKERVEQELGELQTENGGQLDGEARVYHLKSAIGNLGFISSVTQPFCADCTRARLTADGRLRLCLLREKEIDLLTPLRQGADLEDLRTMILGGIWQKPWGHRLSEGEIPTNRAMSEIGG